MVLTIDLVKRFGADNAALEKAAKRGKPDSGLNWQGYNRANPGETQKDSRGRWTDNPVRMAIAQAASNIHSRHGTREEWVGLADIRAEIGDRFSRAEVDAELHHMRREMGVRIIPVANTKSLKPRDHDAALMVGDSATHAASFDNAAELPPPRAAAPKADAPAVDEPRRDPKRQTLGLVKDLGRDDYGDWDDADLGALKAHAAALTAAIDTEQKRRKAAKPKKATARLTSSRNPVDTAALGAELRALPPDLASVNIARERLSKLTIPQLRDLAEQTGVKLPSKGRKAHLAESMVERLVGYRANMESIMWEGRRDEQPKPEVGKPAPFVGSAAHTADLLRNLPVGPNAEAIGRNIIKPMTVPQMKDVAADLGVTLVGRSKADMQNSLYHSTIGRRIGSRAIAEGISEGGFADQVESSRADEINRLTARINAAPDKATRDRLTAQRRKLAGEAMHGKSTSAGSVRDLLAAATSTEDAQKKLLALKLSPDEWKQIARELDIPTGGGAKGIRDGLVKVFTTGRLTTGMFRGLVPGDGDSAPTGLERLMGGRWEPPGKRGGAQRRTPEQVRADAEAMNPGGWGNSRKMSPENIRSAYDELAAGPGEWVSIADLRERFPNASREEMDAMLRELEQRPDVNIVPQSNTRALSERTRGAAVTIGGEQKHFIAMGLGEPEGKG